MENPQFVVVKNHENQYSIWSINRPLPAGWIAQDMKGSKDECLEYIRQVWTDMAPASLRNAVSA